MFRDHALLVPAVPERRGAIKNNVMITSDVGDAWSVDIELHIGNEAKTERGGNGVGIYYLIDGDMEDTKQGVFGYGKRFHGFAIFVNNILQSDG